MIMSRIARGWLAIFLSVVGLVCSIKMLWQCYLYIVGDAPNLFLMVSGGAVADTPVTWLAGLLFWLIAATCTAMAFGFVIRAIQIGLPQAITEYTTSFTRK